MKQWLILAMLCFTSLNVLANIVVNAENNRDDSRFIKVGITDKAAELTVDKLNGALQEFSGYIAALKQAGFEVSEMSVTISLIPVVTLELKQLYVLDLKVQEELLKLHKDKKILSYVLSSLFKAYSLKPIDNFKITAVKIALSIPPHTEVIFSPQ